MDRKIRLIDHRKALLANPDAYCYEIKNNIERLVKTLVPHLKKSGLNVSFSKNFNELSQIINLLFEAQDEAPFLHIEGTELPLCWNHPRDWDKNYIKYEWGHLRSRNQAEKDAYKLENLALYSARCNQIQTSMHIEELMIYGGIIAQRINQVLIARKKLFKTEKWRYLVEELTK